MNIIEKRIDEIIPYEKNPRRNDKAVTYVVNSIKQFGFKVPLVIDKDNVIVCGHTRWKAAKRLKMKTLPCVIADDLTEEQIRAFRLADNKVAEIADWDIPMLNFELGELKEFFDFSDFGFDFSDTRLTEGGSGKEAEDDNYEVSLPEEPKSKVGDIYQLGRHRLMCGDSTNIDDVQKLMNGTKADILITSPPYNVGNGAVLRTHFDKNGQTIEKPKNLYNEYDDNNKSWFELMHDFTENAKTVTNSQFINVQMLSNNKIDFVSWLYENKENLVDIIVWNKHTCPPQMAKNVLNNAFEFVVCLDSEKSSRAIRYGNFHGNIANLFETTKEKNEFAEIHRAVFSIEFVSKILNINSVCKTVVDLFGGTGTTMIACEQLDKDCFMMELDPKYIDVIIDRWEKFTGKKAVKIA